MKKVLLSLLVLILSATTVFATGAAETAGTDDGGLIRVGIINNDPNESGYRTANDADLKRVFTEENGYDASYYYSLRNDEKSLSKAIAAVLGDDPAIKLRLEERNGGMDAGFSSQMKELRAFFGGSLIRKAEKPKETIEDVPKHESIRADEGSGLYTEPDEDD